MTDNKKLPCVDCGVEFEILPGQNKLRHRCLHCKSKYKQNRKTQSKIAKNCKCGARIQSKESVCVECNIRDSNFKYPEVNLFYNIVVGNSQSMTSIRNESVSLVVTSPPYSFAKDYSQSKECLGNSDNYQDYLYKLKKVFAELYRVLIPGRMFVLNVSGNLYKGNTHWVPFDCYNIAKEVGFDMLEDIIWQKPLNPTQMHRGGQLIQNPYPLYFYPDRTYEHIMVFKKPGKIIRTKEDIGADIRQASKYSFEFVKSVINDVWYMNPINATHVGHPAPFPYELPYRVIKLLSHYGDVVLDPFVGSGTSMAVAKNLGRSFIGYEINPDFIPVIEKRLVQEGVKDINFDIMFD